MQTLKMLKNEIKHEYTLHTKDKNTRPL